MRHRDLLVGDIPRKAVLVYVSGVSKCSSDIYVQIDRLTKVNGAFSSVLKH